MKLKHIVIAMGLSASLIGVAQAATPPENTVTKKITLTANINDAIFVSKPDGSTWYGTEELVADDYKQKKFSATLPIRIWTKGTEFNVSLAQPLKMSNGHVEMKNPVVSLTHSGGEGEVKFGSELKIAQMEEGEDGKDEIHNLKIKAEAPASGDFSDGSFSGDLVMLFEPVAAAEIP